MVSSEEALPLVHAEKILSILGSKKPPTKTSPSDAQYLKQQERRERRAAVSGTARCRADADRDVRVSPFSVKSQSPLRISLREQKQGLTRVFPKRPASGRARASDKQGPSAQPFTRSPTLTTATGTARLNGQDKNENTSEPTLPTGQRMLSVRKPPKCYTRRGPVIRPALQTPGPARPWAQGTESRL